MYDLLNSKDLANHTIYLTCSELKNNYLTSKYSAYGIIKRLLVVHHHTICIIELLCYNKPGIYWRGYHVW